IVLPDRTENLPVVVWVDGPVLHKRERLVVDNPLQCFAAGRVEVDGVRGQEDVVVEHDSKLVFAPRRLQFLDVRLQILQARESNVARELVKRPFLLESVEEVRRNHKYFELRVVKSSDVLAYARREIPTKHDHLVETAQQRVSVLLRPAKR